MYRNPTKEEHYYQILKVLEPWVPKKQLEAWLHETMLRFKRRDRVQYILMMIRMRAVLKLLAKLPRDSSDKSVKKLQTLYWKFFDTYADPRQALFDTNVFPNVLPPKFPNRLTAEEEETLWNMLQHQHEQLEHLMDTMETGHYRTALSIVWKNQAVNTPLTEDAELAKSLEAAIEEDRASLQDEFILLEDIPKLGGRLLVDCGNNYSWRILETDEQRRVEAQLMNHCATSHRGTLISLREFVSGSGLRPHLTFEYIADQTQDYSKSVGTLGEMKGFGNNKPSESYHDYIICLLSQHNIIGVVGGGYKPDCNFELKDLDSNRTQLLKARRPDLYDPELLLKDRAAGVLSWAKTHIPKGYTDKIELVSTSQGVSRILGPSFSDIYEAFQFIIDTLLLRECEAPRGRDMHDQFSHLVKVLESPGEMNYSFDRFRHQDLAEIISHLNPEAHQQFRTLLIQLARSMYPEDAQSIVQSFIDDQWEDVPDDLLDKILTAGQISQEIGWESGTTSRMFEELKEIFPLETTAGVVTKDGFLNNVSELLKRGTYGEEDIRLHWEECRKVGRVLHRAAEAQDFDEEVAVDSFLERLREEIP